MKTKLLIVFLALLPLISTAGVEDLLISEIKIVPDDAEFIEIYNKGATPIILTKVYITDATYRNGNVYYYNIVLGNGGGGAFRDFNAKFPDGAVIGAGEYQTVAIRGSTSFFNNYGIEPTYELYEDAASQDGIPDMLPATVNSIDTANSGFTQGTGDGEVAILYTWDGTSDFIQDLDYILWGSDGEAVDKTNITVNTHNYLADTDITMQALISENAHSASTSWHRIDFTEGAETQTGGNGILGADETSEDWNNTFGEAPPTPNGIAIAPNIIINEVDAVGTKEFIEIKGVAGTSLTDVTLVLYQGSDNTNYKLLDLSAQSIPANGYLLISDAASLTPDMPLGAALNDGVAAVAIYFSNISNFSAGGAVITTDIIDAIVYGTGQADNSTLLTLLNASEPQVNENSNSDATNESNARCADGKGGKRNTSSYMQIMPTAGEINNTCPVVPYYANADPTTPVTLRTTLHEIIKDHISYPYSSSSTDTWDVLGFADEDHNTAVDVDPNVAERVWMIYKNNSYVKVDNFDNQYNREHTWPQSKGFPSPDDNAPRTDAHHLMLSDVTYNGNRGNKYFDDCNPMIDNSCNPLQTTTYDGDGDGSTEGGDTGSTYPGNANWTNNSIFEVWDFRKGDIARAMFYMDVRYEGLGEVDSTGTAEPDLTLVEVPVSGPEMGKLSTLLQWHLQDPVDDIERQRNEVVFSYQGNRNPFIDHPEWVACIFENDCPPPGLIFANGFE